MQPTYNQTPALYTLPQHQKRLIIPKIISFLLLGIIFYLGILINISLLFISANGETIIKLIALILLILIVILGIYLNIKKAGKKYFFYKDRITFQQRQILLSTIAEVKVKTNLLDKLFHTYSLKLSKEFTISNIPRDIQLQEYIKKLIAYARGPVY